MIDSDKKQFAEIVRTIFKVMGGEAPSKEALQVWWALLVRRELPEVRNAFGEFARIGKFAPKPAEIIELIDRAHPDGRPTADEAWASIPRDEYTTAVLNEEMAQAMGIAQPLLDEGDQVAARMAFRDAYNRVVDANKRAGVVPQWFASLGYDKAARAAPVADAVRRGRLTATQAAKLLPGQADEILQLSSGRALLSTAPTDADREAVKTLLRIGGVVVEDRRGRC